MHVIFIQQIPKLKRMLEYTALAIIIFPGAKYYK